MPIPASTKAVPRSELVAALGGNPRVVRAFESLTDDVQDSGAFSEALTTAGVLTLEPETTLQGSRVLTNGVGIELQDGGPGGALVIGLTDTAVTPGIYGSPTAWAGLTVNQQGRVTGAISYSFTVAAPIAYDATTRVFSLLPVPVALAGVPAGGTALQVLTKTGAADYAVAWGGTREVACFAENPIAVSKVLLRYLAAVPLTIPANLAGWAVKVTANPAASYVIALAVNGVGAGSITIGTAGTVTLATTAGAAVAVAAGDVLTLIAPNPADGSIAGLAITGPLTL